MVFIPSPIVGLIYDYLVQLSVSKLNADIKQIKRTVIPDPRYPNQTLIVFDFTNVHRNHWATMNHFQVCGWCNETMVECPCVR